jgi:hypothetical protein
MAASTWPQVAVLVREIEGFRCICMAAGRLCPLLDQIDTHLMNTVHFDQNCREVSGIFLEEIPCSHGFTTHPCPGRLVTRL